MGLFDNFKKTEVRSLENPKAPVSAKFAVSTAAT
jgi:hypothetical protein